jgi:two-component system cell cycle sensor histidine kinase/response regulator CckA
LLLMQLPKDSPFRRPIEIMRETGLKAAAIVEDLLALARRGVVSNNEAADLNHVIVEYLDSPVHEKLQEYYPQVEVTTDLESDLLSILGSPVHLSKIVMNLISNAAEAMPGGGTITIMTKNRYIKGTVNRGEEMVEGDYVVLQVSDTGEGIPPEDMERIFEPFYTKKVMGRSGTGLGMAVVWATVKDLKGHIDVQSIVGKGTAFTLYFPGMKQTSGKGPTRSDVNAYRGRGESILVVDDVKEQRDIACLILTELGYSVKAVSAGEEAVVYLKSNSVDLLVLDMIMDPGMDGLETYRQIVEIHPNQKAIIASGFADIDRIKRAQRLGAGPDLKKPYTLEKLCVAVRHTLDT